MVGGLSCVENKMASEKHIRKRLERAQDRSRLCSRLVWDNDVKGLRKTLAEMEQEKTDIPEWLMKNRFNAPSAFYEACRVGSADCAILMMEKGLSPNARWASGLGMEQVAAPLGLAAKMDGEEADGLRLMNELIARGADIEHPDRWGIRPLLAATLSGSEAATRLLLAAGAQTEARCEDGRSALDIAIDYGEARCMRALLEAGADPYAKLRDNPSAADRIVIASARESKFTNAATRSCLAELEAWLERALLDDDAPMASNRNMGALRM